MDSTSDGAAAAAVPLPMPVPAPVPVPASSPTTQSDGGGGKKSKATKGKKRISQDKRVKAKVAHILSATQDSEFRKRLEKQKKSTELYGVVLSKKKPYVNHPMIKFCSTPLDRHRVFA